MRLAHLHYLACPACKSPLVVSRIDQQKNERVESGELQCTGCSTLYPIVRYIPRFVSQENYASSFGFQWFKHARTQYDSTSGCDISRQRFFAETGWAHDLSGQTMLEVGSGSGRFTEHAVATGAMVVSLDYSGAVDANYASNGHHENLLIVQADVYQLPFGEATFDKILCIGVLQHTPDVTKAFHALPPFLKHGGNVVIDVYARKSGVLGRLRHLLKTRYWIRPFVRGMPAEKLYRRCDQYIHFMWPVARILNRIPRVGNKLNWFLLIPDYSGQYALAESLLKSWAILDLFDILSPTFDQPQTIETVRQWFHDARLTDIQVKYGYNGIEGRGTKAHS
jgi:ubiquinone/menaquinone biosynthesis C-methylase UbiE